MSEIVLFVIFGLISIVGAVCVVAARDPFMSALSLIVNFAGLGVLYLTMQEPFVAMSQIIVYAGAVVVLFLFVIAYLGDRRSLTIDDSTARWAAPAGIVTAVLVVGGLSYAVTGGFDGDAIGNFPATVARSFGTASTIGELFLTRYLLEFEVTSLVLMVAAIGGVVLGLTGRSRHNKLRSLGNTRSADQQRRRLRGLDDADARATSEAIDRLRVDEVTQR